MSAVHHIARHGLSNPAGMNPRGYRRRLYRLSHTNPELEQDYERSDTW